MCGDLKGSEKYFLLRNSSALPRMEDRQISLTQDVLYNTIGLCGASSAQWLGSALLRWLAHVVLRS